MLSDNESISATDEYFENLSGIYEALLLAAILIALGFHHLVSHHRTTGSQHHVIDEGRSQNTGNLHEINKELKSPVQGEPKPDQPNSEKPAGDVISKRADESDTSAPAIKKKRSKKKLSTSNLGQKERVAAIANPIEGNRNWKTGTVSTRRKWHSNQIEDSSISSPSSTSQNTKVVKEKKPTNQQDLPERKREIEEIRRILEINHSSDFADGSGSSEERSKGNSSSRKKRSSRSRSSTGTVTPILPKLTAIRVGRPKYVKYRVEIDRDGGILKLEDAQIKFPPGCVWSKVELLIALCQNQKVRRGEEDAIFVTEALHIWRNDTSDPDDFRFNLPIRVNMVKLILSNAGSAKVQRTNSVKNINWEFYHKDCFGGDSISFTIKSLGGYRAVSPKHDIMTHLHYQICVTRTHETDDPDQLILIIKFYTEDMQKSVLADANALPGLEVLKSESIHVQTGSMLLLSLKGIGVPGIPEQTVEFNVPEYWHLYKIKKAIPIALRRLPANFETPDPLSLLLQMSSQFSDTVRSRFYLQWKKAISPSQIVLNVNGTNAIGIQSNYQNTFEVPPSDHPTSTLL